MKTDKDNIQKNILIVDDEISALSSLKRQLLFDYEVYTETCAKTALKLIKNKEVDFAVVIADIRMPEMNGIRFLKEVKELNPDISRVILTGNADSHSVIKAVNEARIFAIIQKPWGEKKLSTVIEAGINEYNKLKNLRENSSKDELTGLYNHETIYEKLHYEVLRSLRYSVKLSALLIDIDQFHKFNNIYGQPYCDKVLKSIAKLLEKEVRDNDLIGRFGDDSFLILFPETSQKSASIISDKIRKKIQNIYIKDVKFSLTVSGGVSEFTCKTTYKLVSKLKILLSRAKNNGKNRIELND